MNDIAAMENVDIVDWRPHAERLAQSVTRPVSRWRPIVAAVPRHWLVPDWWRWRAPAPGPYGSARWTRTTWRGQLDLLETVFADRSLVTRVGDCHADHAGIDGVAFGAPTSSATLPSLLLSMFRHAQLAGGMDILDVGTGSGYGTALLATRFGDERVTSVDIDSYLIGIAAERFHQIGLEPSVQAVNATGPLPGTYDRIIATVSVRPIPASWMTALRPGGRLVTTIAGTGLILAADAAEDGGAEGRIEWDRAGFMATRTGPDYPRETVDLLERARVTNGEESRSQFPVVNVPESWELWSMLTITAPGIEHDFRETDGVRTAVMAHADGSWARATSSAPDGPAYVHQGGPQRLWDVLDELRTRWLRDGSLPVYGATARVDPDGTIHLRRGTWTAAVR